MNIIEFFLHKLENSVESIEDEDIRIKAFTVVKQCEWDLRKTGVMKEFREIFDLPGEKDKHFTGNSRFFRAVNEHRDNAVYLDYTEEEPRLAIRVQEEDGFTVYLGPDVKQLERMYIRYR